MSYVNEELCRKEQTVYMKKIRQRHARFDK